MFKHESIIMCVVISAQAGIYTKFVEIQNTAFGQLHTQV